MTQTANLDFSQAPTKAKQGNELQNRVFSHDRDANAGGQGHCGCRFTSQNEKITLELLAGLLSLSLELFTLFSFFFLYLAARIECQNTGELGES